MHNQLALGSWLVGDRIGKGGAGQVFRATHISNGTIAALKLVSAHTASQKETFDHELNALYSLSH